MRRPQMLAPARVGGDPQTRGTGARVGGDPQTPGTGARVGGDPQTPGTAVFLAFLAVALLGCGQKKITECNAVVQVINAGVVSLEKAPKNEADPSGVSDLRSMADAMDKVAADAAAVQLTLPKLIRLRDDYHKMAKEIAKAERELATAAQERDAARRQAAEGTLDAAVKLEDPLVDQINQFCQAP